MGPFDELPAVPILTDALPVALVVDDGAQADAYLAAGPVPGPVVVVQTASDVPSLLGGMAIITERRLEPELQAALLGALGITA